ncbi:probable serine incorporator isoform X1 [Asparagus officinalis]|nr:probable serine incorporator isoform X1 [Asparagus officinalis]XP_020259959.1 probable serine incorporator isoform X1 [Asparagus officinalis]
MERTAAPEGGSKGARPESSARENDAYFVRRKESLRARYIYGFIFFKTNLFAWFVRDYGHKFPSILHYISVCSMKDNDCFHEGGVLRVSFGCFIYFLLMSVTTYGAKKLHDVRNSWQSRCWALKLVLYLASVMVSFLFPADFIQLYGEVARLGAGIFLLLQLVSVIHFIAWCDNRWMPDSQTKQCGLLGLFLCTAFNIATFGGIVLICLIYARDASCIFNIFLVTWTAVLAKIMMVVSLHSKVNRGLLSSSIMGSYIVFLCWSSIQSEPPIEKCNMQKEMAEKFDWTNIISLLIAICAIVMATFSTGIDSKAFQFRKDEEQSEDDIPYKYDFFHLVFAIGAMHFAMLFINWQQDHPTRKWSIDVGWASTWVKIVNEWFAASLYLWKLVSPVLIHDKSLDHEDPVRLANGSV